MSNLNSSPKINQLHDLMTSKDVSIKKMVDLVKYPVITEKTYIALFKQNQYTFDVDLRLSKPQIKKIFEKLFNVEVISINTHIPPRKKLRVGIAQGFRPLYKRAIITLKEGQSINYDLAGVVAKYSNKTNQN